MKLEALARQKMATVTVEAPTNPAPDLLGTEVGTAGLSTVSSFFLVSVLLHLLC